MPRLTVAVATAGICIVLGVVAGPGHAGDDHVGGSGTCADCHKNGRGLTRQDVNETCLSCHGGAAASAPGVLGTNPSGAPRQAGALNGVDGVLRDHMGRTLGAPDRAPAGRGPPSRAG